MDRSDLIQIATEAMLNVHDQDVPWEAYAEAVIKALCVEEMIASLREMVRTQAEWEDSITKIIGKPVNVFERAIDRAEQVLAKLDGVHA